MDSFVTIKRRKMAIHRSVKVAVRDGHIDTANSSRITRDTYQFQYDGDISQWQIDTTAAANGANNQSIQEESLLGQYTGAAGSVNNQNGFNLWYDWWLPRRTTSPGNLGSYYPFLPNWISQHNQPRPHLQMTVASKEGLRFMRWVQTISWAHPGNWRTQISYQYAADRGYGLGWNVCYYPNEYHHWMLRPSTISLPAAPTKPWQIDHHNNVMINNLQHAANQDALIAADNAYIGKLDTRGGEEIFEATKPGHDKEFYAAIERQMRETGE